MEARYVFLVESVRKKEKPVSAKPKTRADFESTFSVRDESQGGRLSAAFSRPPRAEETKMLKDVLDIVESVPDGKKLLADVATAGYKINFDTFRGASAGACNPVEKQIMLCPANHSSEAAVAASLYHEMTHAMQNERSGGMLADCSKYNIADQVKFLRAAEASAWMEEAKFAHQIKDEHPEVLKFVGEIPMYKAFAAEMEKSGDAAKAGEAAFKGILRQIFKRGQGRFRSIHVFLRHGKTAFRPRRGKNGRYAADVVAVNDLQTADGGKTGDRLRRSK